jgi:hypothetical protein
VDGVGGVILDIVIDDNREMDFLPSGYEALILRAEVVDDYTASPVYIMSVNYKENHGTYRSHLPLASSTVLLRSRGLSIIRTLVVGQGFDGADGLLEALVYSL